MPTTVPTPAPVIIHAAGVAPGACIEYRPAHATQHHVVFIDPGHGGVDSGAIGTTSSGVSVSEKELTLAVGHAIVPLLLASGDTVVLSRNSDTLVGTISSDEIQGNLLTVDGVHQDAEARINCANAASAQVLIALHFNAFDDPTIGGVETIYDKVRSFSAANQRLATLVQQDVIQQLQSAGWSVPDRGITDDIAAGVPALTPTGDAYGHLLELGPAQQGWLDQPSTMPGILCELLFVTDPAEADIAVSTTGQQALARGVVRAVQAFLASPQNQQ